MTGASDASPTERTDLAWQRTGLGLLSVGGLLGARALGNHLPALLVVAGVAALLGLLVLGVLTPWGLFRHWWVVVKLALTTAGAVLALVVLTPTLSGLADAPSPIPVAQRLELVRDSGAASLVLVGTLVLSVYKPFGRVRPVRAVARAVPVPRP